MSNKPDAIFQIASDPSDITKYLFLNISSLASSAIKDHGCFSIALSGGSLPKFLTGLSNLYQEHTLDPQFDKWHIFLADERCVPSTHDDSNLKNIQEKFLNHVVGIPSDQVYGIDESLLEKGSEAVASSYEMNIVKKLLDSCGGRIDCAVLGFGPDGHTCSLFPNHALLKESSKLVASIDDSPKPPPSRITLTYPVLNDARGVIFCGTGSSKGPILKDSFASIKKISDENVAYICHATTRCPSDESPLYPCARVKPESAVVWVLDKAATEDLDISEE